MTSPSGTFHAPSTADLVGFADPEIRIEGRSKVSGRTKYAADIVPPGTLWAAFARSPHAHARIVRIDVTAARAIPGVHAVLTAGDIGGARFGRQIRDWPVLAVDVVRFVGERVAAIAAETREAAEQAARAVQVTYDPLPAVLDTAAALDPGAPLLHPDWDAYDFPAFANQPRPPRPHRNVQGAIVRTKGAADLDAAFARAAHVFEHRFTTQRVHCGYIEPRATVVWIDAAGIVHVHSTNKQPFGLRDQLARTAGLPPAQIVVECTAIGGDFGGKGLTLDEFPCYFLARATGRPVRSALVYADELRDGTTRHEATLVLRTACAADGTFLAHQSRVTLNGGAYAGGKPRPNLVPGFGYPIVGYRVPDVRIDVATVYTNTVPAGHMRGPIDTQTIFAWESHVDMIARALEIDPIALRLRNVVRDGDTMLGGEPVPRAMCRPVLEALQHELQRTPARGTRGIAFVTSHTGGGKTGVKLRLHADGRVEIVTALADQGGGALTLLQRVIAHELGVDRERITLRQGTTAETLPDPGAGASRVTHIVGRAAEDAIAKLRARLAEGHTPAPGAPLEVVGEYDSDPREAPHATDYTFSAYAIDVAIDRATGTPAVLDAVLVADVGPILNPLAHRGQIEGAFVMGLGGALREDLPVDEDGRMIAASLADYKLATIADVPPLRTVFVDTAPGDGPFGAKMVGELGNVGVAPAVANAIAGAAGVRLCDLPLTAERIFTALGG
jgi:CO/xanthine dehydrogenase Mo-binding subunit